MTLSLPTISGLIRRRILVNFRVDPECIADTLPAPFRPKLLDGAAVAGICLIRLEQVRPARFPKFVGVASENAAHRIAVEWSDSHGQTHDGVYIYRRDSNSALNRLIGGRAFPGVHNAARFDVHDATDGIRMDIVAHDGAVRIHLKGQAVRSLPDTSAFASLADASSFFECGADGYSPSADGQCVEGLRLITQRWEVQPLRLSECSSSFFGDSTRFPLGSVAFDCALLMRDIEHTWLPLPALARTAGA